MARIHWLMGALLVGCGDAGVTGPGNSVDGDDPPLTEVDPVEDAAAARGTVPIYGGTMAATALHVVVADPGLDRVFVTTPENPTDFAEVVLEENAEPFRVDIDQGYAFVTLRGTGQVGRVDLQTLDLVTTDVCAEPRGVDAEGANVYVACAGGEFVVLDRQLEPQQSTFVAQGLRDVVIEGDNVWLSTFRDANILRLNRTTLSVQARVQPEMDDTFQARAEPRVAWRMRAHPDGGVLVMHQAASTDDIVLDPDPSDPRTDPNNPGPGESENPYGGNACDPMDSTTSSTHFTRVDEQSVVTGGALITNGPRYDFALDNRELFIPNGSGGFQGDIFLPPTESTRTFVTLLPLDVATAGPECVFDTPFEEREEIVTAIASVNGQRWQYSRERALLYDGRNPAFELQADVTLPAAFDLFHESQGSGLSCATCHPEGQDDGHVWHFADLGPRRTQNISGGVADRAPFHWDGEFDSLDDLMHDVFEGRMGGEPVATEDVDGLADWMNDIPPVKSSPAEPELVATGKALFESPRAACTGCHTGEQYTDSKLHVVREGDIATKTPSLLGVGSRGPWMHDGCAESLTQRFTVDSCGGGDVHGVTSHFTSTDVAAIVAFLETL